MNVIRGDSARLAPSTLPIFTGDVGIHTYVDGAVGEHLRLTLVRFEAGSRTTWHRHAFEQMLVVTAGRGIVATEGRAWEVSAGDIVVVPANERHWHGAAEGTTMAHLSVVTPGETTVLEAVQGWPSDFGA